MLEKRGNYNMKRISEQSKEYIAEALISLMKQKPYPSITIQNIVNKAGLSHVTYYRNFNSKDEIIQFYLDRITTNFIQKTNITYDPNHFEQYITTLFSHLIATKEIGLLLYKANLIHYIKEEFDKIFRNKADNKKEQYHYCFISGGLYNVYYFWLIHGCKETPKQLATLFTDFFSHYTIKD